MKTFVIALTASTFLVGTALAQTPAPTSPTATESEQDATTVQPGSMGAAGGGAAPASGMSPTATESDRNATTVQPGTSAGTGSAAPASGASPTATDAEQDATTVEVGGAPMYSNRTIAENAPNAANLSTLVAAASAAGLVGTLGEPGPFTVFAPDNSAFEALPAGTVETLLEEGNRDQLTSILTYHIVPGTLTAADLADGETLTTVQGGTLTIANSGGAVTVTDAAGNTATVTTADVLQSNGVVHVIDTVLMPE